MAGIGRKHRSDASARNSSVSSPKDNCAGAHRTVDASFPRRTDRDHAKRRPHLSGHLRDGRLLTHNIAAAPGKIRVPDEGLSDLTDGNLVERHDTSTTRPIPRENRVFPAMMLAGSCRSFMAATGHHLADPCYPMRSHNTVAVTPQNAPRQLCERVDSEPATQKAPGRSRAQTLIDR